MRTALIIRKLVTASIALLILLYFVQKTTSPKIIFAPFLICSFASLGKNLGLLFNREKIAKFFDWLFKVVFFLAWFVFLIVACYIAIRDGNYNVIFFTLPFWIGGFFFAKGKLFTEKKKE